MELVLLLIALSLVALRTWMGWRLGASYEIRQLLAALFATLVALRYWYQVAEMITADSQLVAAGVFVALFVAAWLLVSQVVNFRGEVYQSVQPNPVDNVLGAVTGLLSGALLGGSLLLVLVVALPGKWDDFDAVKIPVRLDEVPVAVFRSIEQNLAGVSAESAACAPLPQIQASGESSAERSWGIAWK
jgi:hypothetical protein